MKDEEGRYLFFNLSPVSLNDMQDCVNQALFLSPNLLWVSQWWGSLLLGFLSHHPCWPDVCQRDPKRLPPPQDMVRHRLHTLLGAPLGQEWYGSYWYIFLLDWVIFNGWNTRQGDLFCNKLMGGAGGGRGISNIAKKQNGSWVCYNGLNHPR